MTRVKFEPYVIPAAGLGEENPLPEFKAQRMDAEYDFEKRNVLPEDRLGLGWQVGRRILPYRMQDGYDRIKRDREFVSYVLENEYLKVRVLPEVGGKVTSIFHKPLGRELLMCNPVFQPANLALRDAWTTGGIEWNTAQPGHHYLTCSPVHTARVKLENGEEALRLYAWERVKRFPYSIDLHLPEGSEFLFAHVRILNTNDFEIPMYWWTNMGAPEYPGGRALSPTDFGYFRGDYQSFPVIDGIDHSYSSRVQSAYDLFFRIAKNERKWVANIDEHGIGLIHTSTSRLIGRKLFTWGMGPGSDRWNDYLLQPGIRNLEIQAGLAFTQGYTVPMPAGAEWTWTEAFGCLESDPKLTHSEDWRTAYTEAGRILEEKLPHSSVEDFHKTASESARKEPEEVLFRGLAWGAMECMRAEAADEPCVIPESMPFSADEPGQSEDPWFTLLKDGHFPKWEPSHEPGQFMTQPDWRGLIEKCVQGVDSENWLAWYHLGVMKMENGDEPGAREAWETSHRLEPNAWSLRNLAVLAARSDEKAVKTDLLEQAWRLVPESAALAIEFGQSLVECEEWDRLEKFLAHLTVDVANHERIRLARARLALRKNDFETVERMLSGEFATIREGEKTLTDDWFEMQARRIALEEGIEVTDSLRERVRREIKPPKRLDFRMSAEGGAQYVAPQHAKT